MFYDIKTLVKGGSFSKCWLATSWPLKFNRLPPSQIRSIDVSELCDSLQEVINTEARNPSGRFSLRLSAQLTMGIVKIHQKQADILLRDVTALAYRPLGKPEVQKNKRHVLPKNQVTSGNKEAITIALPEEIEEIDVAAVLNLHMEQNTCLRMQDITLRDETIPPGAGFEDPSCPGNMNTAETVLLPDEFENLDPILPPPENERSSFNNALIPEILITTAEKNIELNETMPIELSTQMENDLFILEDVIPPIRENRVRNRKFLKKDLDTEIPSEVLMERIGNNNVELRCQVPIEDLLSHAHLQPKPKTLFTMPATQNKTFTNVFRHSKKLTEIYNRMLKTRTMEDDKNLQINYRKPQRIRKSVPGASLLQSYVEKNLALNDQTVLPGSPITNNLQMGLTLPTESALAEKTIELYDPNGNIEFRITPVSGTKRKTRSLSLKRHSNEPAQTSSSKVCAMDLPTIEEAPVNNNFYEDNTTGRNIAHNETALGSLDRTLVSLGDTSPSNGAIEIEQFLNDEYGPVGLASKIFSAKKKGIRPLTLDKIVPKSNVTDEGLYCSARRMAARAFTSLLALNQSHVITVKKKEGSSEIMHIGIHPKTGEMLRKKSGNV